MVILYKSQPNTVVLTLSEKMEDLSNAFSFTLTNDLTGDEKTFTATDESTGTDRYNQFTWTENAVEDLNNGTVSLSAGQWTYRAYEVTAPSTFRLVESGRVIVKGDEADTTFFTEGDDNDTVVFDD